jgi:hypothetical protein
MRAGSPAGFPATDTPSGPMTTPIPATVAEAIPKVDTAVVPASVPSLATAVVERIPLRWTTLPNIRRSAMLISLNP